MKSKIRLFLILSILMTLLLPNATVFADSSFNTRVTVRDINKDNEILDGFEYEIVFEDGRVQQLITIDKGTHVISLDKGDYILRESKTIEGYEKSKDLKFTLPVGNSTEWKSELNIYPKHFKGERNYPWPKPIFEDNKNKEEAGETKEPKKDERDLEQEALDELNKYKRNDDGNNSEEDKIDEEDNKDTDKNKDKDKSRKYGKTGESKDGLLTIALIGFAALSVILAYIAGKGQSKEDRTKLHHSAKKDPSL